MDLMICLGDLMTCLGPECEEYWPGTVCCLRDPCKGCPDQHLDRACCNMVPLLPYRLPRRVRRDVMRLELLEAKYGQDVMQFERDAGIRTPW